MQDSQSRQGAQPDQVESPISPQAQSFQAWVRGLTSNEVNVWGEIQAQKRHSYDAMWASMRTFFAINGLVVTVMGVLGRQAEYVQDGLVVGAVAIIGLTITAIALHVHFVQWSTYTWGVVQTTMLERELGFHGVRAGQSGLRQPWRLEGDASLLHDPELWYRRQIRFVGPRLLLAVPYLAVAMVYLVGLVLVAAGFISGYFFRGG